MTDFIILCLQNHFEIVNYIIDDIKVNINAYSDMIFKII